MSNAPGPAQKKSNYTALIIIGSVVGFLFLSCCVCGPVMSLFVTTDLERADSLWDDGKKAEAVAAYMEQLKGLPTWKKPRIYQRVVTYYFDEGNETKAIKVCIESIQQDVKLEFERQELIDLLAAAKARHVELEREAEAGVIRRKKEDEAREAAKSEKLREELRKKLDAYMALLKAGEVDEVKEVHVNVDGDIWTATITVENIWHLRAYQIRLQDAQTLWDAWAKIASPTRPDSARISIVDLRGNEVGGSRVLAGSLIWVQEK